MSQSFGTTASMAEITSRGSSSPDAMSKGIESAGSVAMRRASSFERMAVEKPARGQRVGEKRAAAVGELDHRLARAGPQYATAAEDDRPLRRGQPLDGLGQNLRIGVHAPDPGLIHCRGLVRLVRHV